MKYEYYFLFHRFSSPALRLSSTLYNMKDHSRGRGKRGVGYRTPSMFKAGARGRAINDRQQSGLFNRPPKSPNQK